MTDLALDDRLTRPFVTQLRREAFGNAAGTAHPQRIGAEVELIPVHAATGRIAPIESGDAPATLPVLRALGRRLGWSERRSTKADAPELRTRSGGRVCFEPGGQIEYAAPPNESVTQLAADLYGVASAMREWLEPAGIELVSAGIDPLNTVADVPLRLTGDRYRRMDAHFASIGPHGARMMRQTASIQICLDGGAEPLARWRLLNALAPYLVAVFANSPVYAGAQTGHKSLRRFIWSALDPERTGLAWHAADPVGAYASFAMRARAILLGQTNAARRPFAEHVARETATMDDWRQHLTTLFPEVRPRGYFEVRSTDAIEPEWYAVPLIFLAGLTLNPVTAARAAEVTARPDATLLARAGRCGMGDREIAASSRELAGLSLDGCEALGRDVVAVRDLEVAAAFFDRYTLRDRSPADDVTEPATV